MQPAELGQSRHVAGGWMQPCARDCHQYGFAGGCDTNKKISVQHETESAIIHVPLGSRAFRV